MSLSLVRVSYRDGCVLLSTTLVDRSGIYPYVLAGLRQIRTLRNHLWQHVWYMVAGPAYWLLEMFKFQCKRQRCQEQSTKKTVIQKVQVAQS